MGGAGELSWGSTEGSGSEQGADLAGSSPASAHGLAAHVAWEEAAGALHPQHAQEDALESQRLRRPEPPPSRQSAELSGMRRVMRDSMVLSLTVHVWVSDRPLWAPVFSLILLPTLEHHCKDSGSALWVRGSAKCQRGGSVSDGADDEDGAITFRAPLQASPCTEPHQ